MIVATLTNGTEVLVQGTTVAQLMEDLTAESLTGSAVPLSDKEIISKQGRPIRYGDVAKLEDVAD